MVFIYKKAESGGSMDQVKCETPGEWWDEIIDVHVVIKVLADL